MRFVLHSLKDPEKLLKKINNEMPDGTNVIITESDANLFPIYPDCTAFNKLINLWFKPIQKSESKKEYMGLKLPYLAASAGMKMEKSTILSHTNTNVGDNQLMNYYLQSLDIIAHNENRLSKKDLFQLKNELSNYIKKYAGKCFFAFSQVLIVAKTQKC
jgi:hypothetical protein